MRAILVRIVPLLILALAASGCVGTSGTSATGGVPDDEPGIPDTEPVPDPVQLAIARFELLGAESAQPDAYEPNDQAPFHLGAWGFTYTISDGAISPVKLRWDVEVTNRGAAVSDAVQIDFFGNAPAAPTGGPGDQRQEVPALDAAASVVVAFEIADAAPGVLQSFAVVDPEDRVPEGDESDNVSPGVASTVAGDVDRFSVFQTAGYPIEVRLEATPANYDVEVRAPNGTVMVKGENGGTATESVCVTAPQDGVYEVRVFGVAGARSTSPYRLKISVP